MRQQRICEKSQRRKQTTTRKKKKVEVIQEFKTGRLLTDIIKVYEFFSLLTGQL